MWEKSVSFTCSQGNRGTYFQCSAHSGAFQWVAGVPEVNGDLLYQSFFFCFLPSGSANDIIRRAPPPHEKLQPADRLITPAVSGYLGLSMLPTFPHKGLIIKLILPTETVGSP